MNMGARSGLPPGARRPTAGRPAATSPANTQDHSLIHASRAEGSGSLPQPRGLLTRETTVDEPPFGPFGRTSQQESRGRVRITAFWTEMAAHWTPCLLGWW